MSPTDFWNLTFPEFFALADAYKKGNSAAPAGDNLGELETYMREKGIWSGNDG